MKVTNLYYRTVYKRTNAIKVGVLQFFLAISSWFRVFIEVFTRKHFGERYYLFPLNLFLAVVLSIVPLIISHDAPFLTIIVKNLTWYGYIAAFLIASFKRREEVKREPGVYDFKKFSLSPGLINEGFYKFSLFGKKFTNRQIAVFIEPGFFMVIGIILILLKQNIGYLLATSASVYGYSWAAQYYLGDQFIMDTIDEMIATEQTANTFIHRHMPDQTKGFTIDASKLSNFDFRRRVAENMIETEPAVDVF